jgi:hypothetical protein
VHPARPGGDRVRPAPIPDSEIWPGSQRVVFGPPSGHDVTGDIRPVEVLRWFSDTADVPVLSARCVPDAGDLERLAAGGAVWVSFYGGQLLPFDVDVVAPGETVPPRPPTEEEQRRLMAVIAARPWFQAGLALWSRLKDAWVSEPPVWVLPPSEIRWAGTLLGLQVKVVEGVTPHLAFDLAAVRPDPPEVFTRG